MIAKGDGFKYFIDGEEVLDRDLHKLVSVDMTVEIDGFNVYYSSPKKPFTLTELPVGITDINNFVMVELENSQKESSEEVKKLHRICMEQLYKLFVSEGTFPIKLEDFIKNSAQKENKTENMNRLLEEELERQGYKQWGGSTLEKNDTTEKEQNWSSNNTGGILGSERVILNLKGKPLPFFANENLAQETAEQIKQVVKNGKKETENKVDYSEIDWQFIEGLAKRMNKNKEKYEPFNYHKPMDVELLKQSLLRHTIEIMKGNYDDAGQEFGHLYAVALNSQMIYYQLKNNK